MIAYLNGQVLKKGEKSLILEINGVGYAISTTTQTLADIEENDTLELFIHTHVREDEITLYGFPTLSELQFFKLLLTVNGIGPKLANEIISGPINLIKNAIFSQDIAALTKIPGLGKKTAERLILELKNKVEPILDGSRQPQGLGQKEIDPDAVEALMGLGYSRYQVVKTLSQAEEKLPDVEQTIKYFLKNV